MRAAVTVVKEEEEGVVEEVVVVTLAKCETAAVDCWNYCVLHLVQSSDLTDCDLSHS